MKKKILLISLCAIVMLLFLFKDKIFRMFKSKSNPPDHPSYEISFDNTYNFFYNKAKDDLMNLASSIAKDDRFMKFPDELFVKLAPMFKKEAKARYDLLFDRLKKLGTLDESNSKILRIMQTLENDLSNGQNKNIFKKKYTSSDDLSMLADYHALVCHNVLYKLCNAKYELLKSLSSLDKTSSVDYNTLYEIFEKFDRDFLSGFNVFNMFPILLFVSLPIDTEHITRTYTHMCDWFNDRSFVYMKKEIIVLVGSLEKNGLNPPELENIFKIRECIFNFFKSVHENERKYVHSLFSSSLCLQKNEEVLALRIYLDSLNNLKKSKLDLENSLKIFEKIENPNIFFKYVLDCGEKALLDKNKRIDFLINEGTRLESMSTSNSALN